MVFLSEVELELAHIRIWMSLNLDQKQSMYFVYQIMIFGSWW